MATPKRTFDVVNHVDWSVHRHRRSSSSANTGGQGIANLLTEVGSAAEHHRYTKKDSAGMTGQGLRESGRLHLRMLKLAGLPSLNTKGSSVRLRLNINTLT